MEIQKDFKELLELLNKNNVEYLVVGGYALAFYGSPRFTGDIDIFINSTLQNSKKILKTLIEFGFASLSLKEEDFINEGTVIQLGVSPVRVDILTSLTGVLWKDAWVNRNFGKYDDIEIPFIGLEDFITNKKATNRYKDLADLESLERL